MIIPVSVLIPTKNEARHIARCLGALECFAQVIVIDSHSVDLTVDIARKAGADVVSYQWDGRYPKKRGWCLSHLDIACDWVFWVDADEVVTPELIAEIRALFADGAPDDAAGFFVRGQYVWRGAVLARGMLNNKIALMDRRKMEFPVVNDLDIAGMGEIEGHYQPVLKAGAGGTIGQLSAPLLHYAYEDEFAWHARHERYAAWEAEMTIRGAWPKDPVWWRQVLKVYLRASFMRPYVMFLHSYVLKFGFLDGAAGYDFARSRMEYCKMIRRRLKSRG